MVCGQQVHLHNNEIIMKTKSRSCFGSMNFVAEQNSSRVYPLRKGGRK